MSQIQRAEAKGLAYLPAIVRPPLGALSQDSLLDPTHS